MVQDAVQRWVQVDRLLDRVLALPPADRAAFVRQQTTEDPRLCSEVLSLLAALETRDDLLDRPAVEALKRRVPEPDLQPGHRIGAYRLLSLLGRGGMGEVYLAERADGQFEQRVALKLLRQDAIEHLGLFVSERRILAQLEHPGIARLYDAGVDADGRPYMVVELVEGIPITDWCRQHKSALAQRLDLFTQVCDAVAYAHQHLVIHRDLKPANILVTDDGRIKLLDFGVAKLLSGAVENATRNTPLTLAYAAPEQLTHGAMSTATDIYSLGMLLFELLTSRLPWNTGELPVALVIDKLMNAPPPAPSAIARLLPAPPVPSRQLAGDLDAIVAKALRKTANDRYQTVAGLRADVQRHLHGEPVVARGGARMYVAGRFLRRYRFAVAATALVIVALAAGLAGTLWQARRAEHQARLAIANRDFMMGLFAAQDPRTMGDTPRSELTVRQLLDNGVARVGHDFANEPEVQIELLFTAARIYESLGDQDHLAAVRKRRAGLARAYYGPSHPLVIEGMINDAASAVVARDDATAARLLADSDRLLTAGRQDRSEVRAEWWQAKARLLGRDTANGAARTQALERGRALFAAVAPRRDGHAAILAMMAIDVGDADPARARRLLEQAIAIGETATDRSDGHLAEYLFNLARTDERLGDLDAAVAAYARGEKTAMRTYGAQHPTYHMLRMYHARLLHLRGDVPGATAIFKDALARRASGADRTGDLNWGREVYAESLAVQGDAALAVPLLRETRRANQDRPMHDYDVRESNRKLGDAEDRVGDAVNARAHLLASRDEYLSKEGASSRYSLPSRERWARFLIDHATPASRQGDADLRQAQIELQAVVAHPAAKTSWEGPLAEAGLARIALAQGRTEAAVAEARTAVEAIDRVHALYDVRIGPRIWLVYAETLLAGGDRAVALVWARRAAAASRRFDVAGAASITQADAVVARAAAGSQHLK